MFALAFVLLVGVLLTIENYKFEVFHISLVVFGYYICWFINYSYDKQRQKMLDQVVNDFGESAVMMGEMLETIKHQNKVIKKLEGKTS